MCAKFWFSAIIYAKVIANNSFPQVNALVPGLNTYSKKKTHANFMEKNYRQAHGKAMGTKVAVAFANIFMVRNSFNCFYFS